MIAGEKTKLKPRDTFIVNGIELKNGDSWAELFKLGDKITKRPQLVKTADLMLLPTGRAAKSRAKLAIKEMVPYIKAIVSTMVPTHSWSYERLLQYLEDDDLDIDDEVEVQNEEEDKEDGSEGEKGQTLLPPRFPRVTPRSQRTQSLENLLDNPSLQMYPQHPEQVKLDAVQRLADVFESVYSSQGSSSSSSESSTSRAPLAPRPRPSYKRYR